MLGLGCTETRSPGIGMLFVLASQWRPPDVHIFGTDLSLVHMVNTYVLDLCHFLFISIN